MDRFGSGARFGALIAVLWTALSIWQPETTYHFGPLIFSFALAVGFSASWFWRLTFATGASLATIALALTFGGLLGPDFFGNNAAGPEAILATFLGATLGTIWGEVSEARTHRARTENTVQLDSTGHQVDAESLTGNKPD